MRFLLTLLLLSALLVAQDPKPSVSSVPSVVSPSPQDPNAQHARALLQQSIQALGGEAWLNYQDMVQEGRYSSFYEGRPSGVGNVFVRYWKWPGNERLEMFHSKEWVVLFTGDQGYDTTFRGTRLVDHQDLLDYLHRRDHSLEVVLRRWLPDPGTTLFYEGSALSEQKPVEKVTLVSAANDSVTLYLDTYSHLPVKKTYQVRDPVSRERDEEGEVYDHYKLIQGIQTPVSIVRLHNGQMTAQYFLTQVRYNQGLSDALFSPPPLNYDHTKK